VQTDVSQFVVAAIKVSLATVFSRVIWDAVSIPTAAIPTTTIPVLATRSQAQLWQNEHYGLQLLVLWLV